MTDTIDNLEGDFPISPNARARCEQIGVKDVSLVRLVRLARILGRSIAAGLNDHDAEMRDAEAEAQRAADPISAPLVALLESLEPLAQTIARQPRPAGSILATFYDRYSAYILARRAVENHGG